MHGIIHHTQCLFLELFIEPRRQRLRVYPDIEPEIQPLVAAFNDIEGCTTLASCRGHIAGLPKAPYVYCLIDTQQAQKLSALLTQLNQNCCHHYWSLTGRFTDENKLAFRLTAEDLTDEAAQFRGWFSMGWHRERLNADLAILTDAIRATFTTLAHRRQ